MDPMDYAFNHASSSEAPYHISVTGVPPPWMSYDTGPDVGTGGGPFYAFPAALPPPFGGQNTTSRAGSYAHSMTPSTWSTTVLHDSATQEHSSLRPVSLNPPSSTVPQATSAPRSSMDSAIWSSASNGNALSAEPTISPNNEASQTSNSFPQVDGRSCFGGLWSVAAHEVQLRSQAARTNERMPSSSSRNLLPEPNWHSFDVSNTQNSLENLLPSIRSQIYFQHGNAATSRSPPPPVRRSSPPGPISRSRMSRSAQTVQTHQSVANSGVAVPAMSDEIYQPPNAPTTSSLPRTERQSLATRTNRGSRYSLDAQRPPAVSVDVNGSPRPTFATAFDSAATAVPVTAPRRQRPSRPGARRPVTTPRSPPHSHHRNQIDRALVQDFLASQNIRPSDQITGQPYSMIEELLYRNLQALQTTMSQGRIARRSMVTTLPSVPLDELPPDERACTICYGDFGVKSPEGTTEEALRLPECKHVFGSACLRTWLADSDRCPYCRRKLPSEPKWFHSSAKRVLAVLKRSPNPGVASGDTETCLAILRGYSRGGWLERDELSSPYASPSSLPDGRHFERVSGPPQDYGPGTNVDRIIAARDRRIAASEAVESALRRDGRAEPTVGPLFGVLSSEQSSEESRL